MTLDVRFMSAFVPKDVLEAHFPDGMEGFRLVYPRQPEDEHLVRFCAMSWDDLGCYIDVLRALGVPVEGNFAVADMMGGPMLGQCERIGFESEGEAPFHSWQARLIC